MELRNGQHWWSYSPRLEKDGSQGRRSRHCRRLWREEWQERSQSDDHHFARRTQVIRGLRCHARCSEMMAQGRGSQIGLNSPTSGSGKLNLGACKRKTTYLLESNFCHGLLDWFVASAPRLICAD